MMSLELTEVFRPWVLVALGLAMMPFAIVLVRRLLRPHPGSRHP